MDIFFGCFYDVDDVLEFVGIFFGVFGVVFYCVLKYEGGI